jgi:hypothetical protein
MDIRLDMIIPVIGLTILVVLFMGPGMWSSSTGYPIVEKPWRWLKQLLFKRRK